MTFTIDQVIKSVKYMMSEMMIDVMHEHAKCDDRERSTPIPLLLYCPAGHLHIDEGEWAERPHKTHQCQVFDDLLGAKCDLKWRPSQRPTVGVAKL